MLKPRSSQGGVSLVELAVGMGVLGVLLALAAPGFGAWIQGSKIRTAAEAIQNGLQLARVEALRLNTRAQFQLSSLPTSDWTVGCVVASPTCPASIQTRSAAEGSGNVQVSAASATVIFNGLGKLVSGSGNIDISNPTGGPCAPVGPMRCLRVTVSAGGQTRLCDPVLPATNPQGC